MEVSGDTDLPLTERMRNRSKDQHDKSDRLVNLKLALVLTSKPLYAEAISLFWPIYRELELLLQKNKEHPQLGRFQPLLPCLRRAHLFENDMRALLGDKSSAEQLMSRRIYEEEGREKFCPPELQEYIDHLRKLSDDDPLLLLPYAYSMYSAILAGGSIIKRMVRKAFSLKTDEGVETFTVLLEGSSFKNIADFRSALKRALNDEMEIADHDKERIVDETPKVFIRNNKLVATVKDTDVFQEVWGECRRYLLVILSLAVAIVGIRLFQVYGYP